MNSAIALKPSGAIGDDFASSKNKFDLLRTVENVQKSVPEAWQRVHEFWAKRDEPKSGDSFVPYSLVVKSNKERLSSNLETRNAIDLRTYVPYKAIYNVMRLDNIQIVRYAPRSSPFSPPVEKACQKDCVSHTDRRREAAQEAASPLVKIVSSIGYGTAPPVLTFKNRVSNDELGVYNMSSREGLFHTQNKSGKFSAMLELYNSVSDAKQKRASGGCSQDSPFCTDCLLFDSFVSQVVTAAEEGIDFYTTTYQTQIQTYLSYSKYATGRNESNPYPKVPEFSAAFYKKLVANWGSDSSSSLETGSQSESGGDDPSPITSLPEKRLTVVTFITWAINRVVSLHPIDQFYKWLNNLIGHGFRRLVDGTSPAAKALNKVAGFFTCNYSALYTCSGRNMSFLQGILTSVVIFVVVRFFMSKLSWVPLASLASIVITFYAFLLVTYNSSPVCVVPPSCLLDDVVELFSDTLFPPCLQWGGMIVPEEFTKYDSYQSAANATSCPACDSPFSVVQCSEDLQFYDFFDSAVFAGKLVPVKDALFLLKYISPNSYDSIQDNKSLFDYLAEAPILGAVFNSSFFRAYYSRFSMKPGSIDSKDPAVKAYVESQFAPDGSTIPTVYKACFAVTSLNWIIPLIFAYQLLGIVLDLLLVAAGIATLSLITLWSGVYVLYSLTVQINVFIVEHNSHKTEPDSTDMIPAEDSPNKLITQQKDTASKVSKRTSKSKR